MRSEGGATLKSVAPPFVPIEKDLLLGRGVLLRRVDRRGGSTRIRRRGRGRSRSHSRRSGIHLTGVGLGASGDREHSKRSESQALHDLLLRVGRGCHAWSVHAIWDRNEAVSYPTEWTCQARCTIRATSETCQTCLTCLT